MSYGKPCHDRRTGHRSKVQLKQPPADAIGRTVHFGVYPGDFADPRPADEPRAA
jgi:hypothetical protein